jgi:hypothetical protein
MSQEDTDALKNASAIIERFGGIRPMAAKIGAPVTTVQGWKKRDVIPGTRRGDVIKAANDNGINIDDLLADDISEITSEIVSPFIPSSVASMAGNTEEGEESTFSTSADSDEPRITIEPLIKPQVKPLPSSFQNKVDTTHEDLMNAIAQGQKKAVSASLWSTAIFVVLVGTGAAVLLWPSAQKIEKHESQLATIEGKMSSIDNDVQTMNEAAKFLKGMIPAEVQKGISDLREQADTIQKTVTDVAIQAEDIRDSVLATDAGSLADRLTILEARLRDMDGAQGLADLTSRVRTMEETFSGQTQLSASVEELRKIVDSLDGQVNTLDTKLTQSQQTDGSALGETLDGVKGSDLKAAAMLIAFSQLRNSLNRNEPFSNDLVVLQKLAGKDNPELQEALTKLAPQAEKGGVLTSAGLSNELKTMTGDIVFSSLKGEDVSIKEKAKVRLSEIVNVKKDGQVVGGNTTQQTVAQAQALLDAGDVKGALDTLKTLEGESREAADPLIGQAEMTLAAEQVQNLLRQTILSNAGAEMPQVPTTMPSINVDDIKAKVQEAIPGGQGVVKDEESGFQVLPSKGFKGLTQ